MALLIQVASVITVWSRVLCNRIEFGKPATFTMPVIERFPIAGSFLFTPLPGRRGEWLRVAYPMCSRVPRDASIAIIKGCSYIVYIS